MGLRQCSHFILIDRQLDQIGDTQVCARCRSTLRFDGRVWLLDTVEVKVERELVEVVHREIVDDSTFNEALRTILVERGAIQGEET